MLERPRRGPLIKLCSCSIQYGAQLEKVTFQFSTADFVYMLLTGMAALLVKPVNSC